MKSIDPLHHIRSHPEMYLPGGQVDPADMASRLAGDALTLGATRTLVIHQQTWFAIAADLDWLAGAAIEEPFRRILPFTKAGINSFRAEILLAAFADDVVTWDGRPMVAIKGTSTGLSPIRSSLSGSGWQRVVAFRLNLARTPFHSHKQRHQRNHQLSTTQPLPAPTATPLFSPPARGPRPVPSVTAHTPSSSPHACPPDPLPPSPRAQHPPPQKSPPGKKIPPQNPSKSPPPPTPRALRAGQARNITPL